jgi:hypothetical protein
MSDDKKPVLSDWEAEGRAAARSYRDEIKFDEIVELLRDNHPRCVVPKSKWVQ